MSLVDDARRLPREQKLAGGAALALFVTMFLPWYQETHFDKGRYVHDSLNAFQVFTWVEAAVLLVAASVLFLLWTRSQKRGFHLPGGDGFVVMLAGGWTVLLLVWRLFDKPSLAGDVGIDWGIFVALLAAGTLTWAGVRMRVAHRPEPPLPAARGPRRPRAERAPDRRRHTAPTEPLGDRRTHTAPTQPLNDDDEHLAIDDPPAFEPPRRSR
ncbi:MAG TPA: hypothetical protein VHR88_06870 [Solirubrobacteraceae bacterium]|nr:hypothetical protein [Solirubrobacteraceae bacterium]